MARYRFDRADDFFIGDFFGAAREACVTAIEEENSALLGVSTQSADERPTLKFGQRTEIHGSPRGDVRGLPDAGVSTHCRHGYDESIGRFMTLARDLLASNLCHHVFMRSAEDPILPLHLSAPLTFSEDLLKKGVRDMAEVVDFMHKLDGGHGVRLCREGWDGQRGIMILQRSVQNGIKMLLSFKAVNPTDPHYLLKHVENLLKRVPQPQ
jgi:hypothetical protein